MNKFTKNGIAVILVTFVMIACLKEFEPPRFCKQRDIGDRRIY